MSLIVLAESCLWRQPLAGARSTVLSFYIIALIDRQGVLHMVSDGNVEGVFLIFRQRIVRVS